MKRFLGVLTLYAVLLLILFGCSSTATTEKEDDAKFVPEKPIDFIIPFSPGGGTDIMSRMIGKTLNDEGIVDQQFVMTNKVGGGSALAMNYLYEQSGDPYTLMSLPGNGSVLIDGTLDYAFDDFTPLALLAKDPNLILVSKDSKFKTIDQFIKAVKENPNTITAGGTSSTGAEAFVWYSIANRIDSEFKYVPFSSGSEVTTALLGGNVDAAIANPAEAMELIKADKVRASAVTADKRIDDLPDVPTLKESGIDFTNYMLRGVWAAGDISQAALDFWNNAFKKLANSEAWQKKYIEKNNLNGVYMNNEEYTKLLKDNAKEWNKFLEDMTGK